MSRTDIAVVVIGRNEGARLDRCLVSLRGLPIIYVDSGSVDGSADRARATGVEVIELDPAQGFSAARGRNAGLDRLIADPAIAYVQMIDGDCTLEPDWIMTGSAALDADPGLGAVFGRLREDDPGASIYNWLCDVEWRGTPGPATVFGGIVLLRAAAVRHTGGYRADMIAGEDPEHAIRMRAAGWTIRSLPAPMATHEASLPHFRSWWRRTIRAGHAFAELAHLHPRSPLHDFARNRLRILFWGGAVPLGALAGLLLAATVDRRWIALAIAAPLLAGLQIGRVTLHESRRYGPARAFVLAVFLAIGKYAEMIGLIRFHLDTLCGRKPRLIDYKAP